MSRERCLTIKVDGKRCQEPARYGSELCGLHSERRELLARRCIAKKRKGGPCRGMARKGDELCGPHADLRDRGQYVATSRDSMRTNSPISPGKVIKRRATEEELGGDWIERQEARERVKRYQGDFEFLVDMREKAKDPSWTPTSRQTQAIFKCLKVSQRPKVPELSVEEMVADFWNNDD